MNRLLLVSPDQGKALNQLFLVIGNYDHFLSKRMSLLV